MITTSNSPTKGGGIPNQLLGDRLHTIAISGLSRVRTELFPLLVIPSLAPHPVHANRQLPGHGDLGNFSSSPHGQVEILATVLGAQAEDRGGAKMDTRRVWFLWVRAMHRDPVYRRSSDPEWRADSGFRTHHLMNASDASACSAFLQSSHSQPFAWCWL
jgi:hypothetical protein